MLRCLTGSHRRRAVVLRSFRQSAALSYLPDPWQGDDRRSICASSPLSVIQISSDLLLLRAALTSAACSICSSPLTHAPRVANGALAQRLLQVEDVVDPAKEDVVGRRKPLRPNLSRP